MSQVGWRSRMGGLGRLGSSAHHGLRGRSGASGTRRGGNAPFCCEVSLRGFFGAEERKSCRADHRTPGDVIDDPGDLHPAILGFAEQNFVVQGLVPALFDVPRQHEQHTRFHRVMERRAYRVPVVFWRDAYDFQVRLSPQTIVQYAITPRFAKLRHRKV